MNPLVERKGFKLEPVGAPKKKKEKKSKPKVVRHVHIIDDDAPVPFGTTATAPDAILNDEIPTVEDDPVVVGIIDERPKNIREKERFTDPKRWRAAAFEEVPEPSSVGPQPKPTKSSSSRQKQNGSDDSDPDIDRRQSGRNNDRDSSPPRRKTQRNDDPSPPRRRRQSDDNPSPPGRRDLSPSRRKRDDPSPPRRRRQSDDDPSPPRRKRDDSSPPRKKPARSNDDSSPPRGRDTSPGRRKHDDSSRKRHPRENDDPSPPRRRDRSLPSHQRNDRHSRQDSSPPSTHRRQPKQEPSSPSTHRRPKQNSSPPPAPSQPAKSERRRLAEHKEQIAERYTKWGRGIAQVQQTEEAVKDYLEQAEKPLARYKDDKDLDAMLKQRLREDDPMAKYLTNNTPDVGDQSSSANRAPAKPRYRGPDPQKNRFDIWPGYRWDGVDRSNGYEKKLFESIAKRHAQAQEAYLWSVEDM